MIKEAVPLKLHAPVGGVELTGGPLLAAFENNIGYLKSLSIDSILYWFRVKAGLPAAGKPYRGHFEDNIKGQTAGLFLMGAANSLRWKEDAALRAEVEAVVDGIERAAEPDGFFEPIARNEFGTLEYPNYVRVWMNYGLKAASLIGNQKALPLMRGMQSWFNTCDERPIVKYLALAYQGVIANTTVALSEVGLPEDIQAVEDWYQEDWWLGQFIRYHANIDIQKDCDFSTPVSCCAGLGTRILGSLPEFLYSVDDHGITVDIYADSRFTWQSAHRTAVGGDQYRLVTRTTQPAGGEVTITLEAAPKEIFALRLRASRYQGLDSVSGCERYAFEWGPLLLGAVGRLDARGRYLLIDQNPERPETWMTPIDGKPGYFSVRNKPECNFIPYHEIGDEVFTCYPVF